MMVFQPRTKRNDNDGTAATITTRGNVAAGGRGAGVGARRFQGVRGLLNRRIGGGGAGNNNSNNTNGSSSIDNGKGSSDNVGALAKRSSALIDSDDHQELKQTLPNAVLPVSLPTQTNTARLPTVTNTPCQKLSNLMFDREWESLYDAMFDEETGQPLPASKVLNFEGNAIGETILHVICRYQPPLDLVQLVVETWPFLIRKTSQRITGAGVGEAASASPSRQQTALHLACEYGSRSDIVKYLLQQFGEAAMIIDVNGQVPLHLACRPKKCPPPDIYYRLLTRSNGNEEEDEPEEEPHYIQPGSAVIKALCAHSPKAVNVEDLEGCNPIEIAIAARDRQDKHIAIPVSKTVCQILLDTSKEAWELDREQCSEDLLEEQDEKFSLPGYTPAAARALLVKCRSNNSLRSLDVNMSSSMARGSEPASLNHSFSSASHMSSSHTGAGSSNGYGGSTRGIGAAPQSLHHSQPLNLNSFPRNSSDSDMLSLSLPPYEDMLQRYRQQQSPYTSAGAGTSYSGNGAGAGGIGRSLSSSYKGNMNGNANGNISSYSKQSQGPGRGVRSSGRMSSSMRRNSVVKEGVPSLGLNALSQNTSGLEGAGDWGWDAQLPPLTTATTSGVGMSLADALHEHDHAGSGASENEQIASPAPAPPISLLSAAMEDYDQHGT